MESQNVLESQDSLDIENNTESFNSHNNVESTDSQTILESLTTDSQTHKESQTNTESYVSQTIKQSLESQNTQYNVSRHSEGARATEESTQSKSIKKESTQKDSKQSESIKSNESKSNESIGSESKQREYKNVLESQINTESTDSHTSFISQSHLDSQTLLESQDSLDIENNAESFNSHNNVESTDSKTHFNSHNTIQSVESKNTDSQSHFNSQINTESTDSHTSFISQTHFNLQNILDSQLPFNFEAKREFLESKGYGGYDYKSLNKYGDFCGHTGTHYSKNFDYLAVNLKLSPFFLSEYNRLVEFAKSKNIKVFLTYPVTLENLGFSLNDSKTFEKIQNLKAQLKTHNIEIYGDFRDFHFVRKYFFDTSYHLNSEGAALRTQAFLHY